MEWEKVILPASVRGIYCTSAERIDKVRFIIRVIIISTGTSCTCGAAIPLCTAEISSSSRKVFCPGMYSLM
jgi:hypothetical protein